MGEHLERASALANEDPEVREDLGNYLLTRARRAEAQGREDLKALFSQHLAGVDRDGHLLSGDFFENDAHPHITFDSTEVAFDGETWDITGDLTIKGVSHPVTIPFELTGSAKDPFGNTRVGFEGATSINRSDWGLTFNAALETGGVLVSEKIKLEFDVSAIKNA